MLLTTRKMLAIGVSLASILTVSADSAHAQLITTPISYTGGNANLIYDESQTNGTTDSSAPVVGLGDYAYAANLTGTAGGLPSNLNVSTAEGNSYQVGPLSANSGARLDIGSVELTLNTPTVYSDVGFLVSGANGGGTVDYTLNFQNGSTFTGSFTVPDWYSGSTPTSSNHSAGYTVVGTGSGSLRGSVLGGQFTSTLYMYDFTTGTLSDSSALTSIDFTEASGGQIGVFAISGEVTGAVPEPSTYALFILGGALLFVTRVLRRRAL